MWWEPPTGPDGTPTPLRLRCGHPNERDPLNDAYVDGHISWDEYTAAWEGNWCLVAGGHVEWCIDRAIARRRRISAPVRRALKKQHRSLGGRCYYCRVAYAEDIDHVVPIARGGDSRLGNLVPACWLCNTSKFDSLLIEWRVSGVDTLPQ